MQTPSFLENLTQLQSLKHELLTLQSMFSPTSINYHQLTTVSSLRKQLQATQKELGQLKELAKAEMKEREGFIEKLEGQRKELQEVNLELVRCNDRLVGQLQVTSARLEKVVGELEHERQLRKQQQLKHTRQLQNLKLIHSQQLYILKKKQRKQNP